MAWHDPDWLIVAKSFWCAITAGTLVGCLMWDAEGRWRKLSLAGAFGAFIVACMPLGITIAREASVATIDGVVAGWAIGVAWGGPLVLAAAAFVLPHCWRAAIWGVTAVIVEILVADAVLGWWLDVLLMSGLLTVVWAGDFILRPGQWLDRRLTSWQEDSADASAIIATAYALLCPAVIGMLMRAGAPELTTVNAALVRAFPFADASVDAFLVELVTLAAAGLGICATVRTRQDRTAIALFLIPACGWLCLARVVPADFATWGVGLALTFTITAWFTTLIRGAAVQAA